MDSKKPVAYLSYSGVAKHTGLAPSTIASYKKKKLLPVPDVTIGHVQGWSVETIDHWMSNRLGRGHRSDIDRLARGEGVENS